MDHQLFANIPPSIMRRVSSLNLNIPSQRCTEEVNEILQKTVLMGGKRLRPLLTFLMGQLFFVDEEVLDPYAKAIEMVHGASLSHDDVIDNATKRRGRPSINILASNKKAVLAGDILLADVIVNLSELGNLTLVKEMSLIIKDLSVGEWLQLDAAMDRQYGRELITNIALKKTSSVMSWCCFVPAILSSRSPLVIRCAREFGAHLGHAFQLMDDTLDFNFDGKKDPLLDLQNGQINSVLFEWLEMHPPIKERFMAGENMADLFHREGLAEAVAIVVKLAHEKLAAAKELLLVIERELHLNATKSKEFQEVLKPIHLIIEYLGERRF